jgi:hypothetical protein
MPMQPKEFEVRDLDPKMAGPMRPYTKLLDFFFRCIRADIEKLEGIDYEDLLSRLKVKVETGNLVIGKVDMEGTMSPDLTGRYVCDLGDPLYNTKRTYSMRKYQQDWWIWWDSSTSRWYLSYAKGAKTGYRWYASDLDATWTAEGGVLS